MKKSEELYIEYRKKVYHLAFSMTGNAEDAKDITQETFIKVFESLDKFNEESQIYTWIYSIAKNNCLRFLERKKRTSFLALQNLAEKVSSPVIEEITENEKSNYISQVKEGCLIGLLRCLSLQQRLVFILNVILDLPINQVAAIIDKSQNATRILVFRSRQKIKDYLCANCSLYDSENQCRCENLINFSLKQGWIRSNYEMDFSLKAESEIKDLKNMVAMYKSLPEKIPEMEFSRQIQNLLTEKEDLLILNGKKVK
jgi:RNA polymerase sigma factor (sigma-70 family)